VINHRGSSLLKYLLEHRYSVAREGKKAKEKGPLMKQQAFLSGAEGI
jgi:hypothetical protein